MYTQTHSEHSFKDFDSLECDDSDDIAISKFDGNIMTFLRFCAKCFVRGGDEKSGCYTDFSTYCSSKSNKNFFISFRGNRFNVIFLMAGFAFYHKNDILDFFQNFHGANNFVQKVTLQLCKSSVVLAECKVLGLISKLITGPLWRIIEQNRHVLDMNFYYVSLLNFFKEQSENAEGLWRKISVSRKSFGEGQIL